MTDGLERSRAQVLARAEIDRRIGFDPAAEVMQIDFTGLSFERSAEVNAFYDRIEERIAETGENLWFFLVIYSQARFDTPAWVAHARRGKALNLAHSMGSVRVDASDITRRQIEHAAGTEAFDPNLFADRASALAALAARPSRRIAPLVHVPSYSPGDFARRVRFLPDEAIMEIDLSGIRLLHSRDVNDLYDALEAALRPTGRKWYFLIDYDGTRIMSEAWVRYAARGKALNLGWSLGTVRYAPGSETEADIRLRSESQDFQPNFRNSRAEALARIAEMKAGGAV